MNRTIKFAFAVNRSNVFESKHFGDADKYLIFEWDGKKILHQNELINKYKFFDEENNHGSKKKGEVIIKYLKKHEVKVLVSKQFGKNIKMVNQHFIPIIISAENIDETIKILKKNIGWIKDELQNNPKEYKLFTMKNGTLKTIIKKDE